MRSLLKALPLGAVVIAAMAGCAAQNLSRGKGDPLIQLSNSMQRVVAKVTPAIVTVEVTGYVSADDDDDDNEIATRHDTQILTKMHSLGSGIIVDSNGYVITNAHVVEGARQVRITLDEKLRDSHARIVAGLESLTFNAHLVGTFEQADLALLRIDVNKLPTVPIADSDSVQPGQLVFSIGSPEGLKNSVSMGFVSAVGRNSESDRGATFIQTDAAINPGSSGGALVDENGDLIGVTTLVVTDNGANGRLGFALPSRLVQSVFQELKTTGHVAFGDIGVKVQNITTTMARGLQISQDWGIIISDVTPGSSAEKAGVQVQDLVLDVDGQSVSTVPEFFASFYGKRVGDVVQLRLLRGLQQLPVSVQVLDHPPDSERPHDADRLERGLVGKLGVVCLPLDQQKRSTGLPFRSTAGVMVVARLAGTIGIKFVPGDIIRSVNGKPVESVDSLRSVIDHLNPLDSVVLQIERQRQFQYIFFELD